MQHSKQVRIHPFQQYLASWGVDAVLLFNSSRKDSHVTYVSGIDYEYLLVLVTPSHSEVYVSPLEYERAQREARVPVTKIAGNPLQYIAAFCKHKNIKTLGFNASFCSINELRFFKKELRKQGVTIAWKDVSKKLNALRQIKTAAEHASIRKACSLTDAIFLQTLKKFRTFTTEADVVAYMQCVMRTYGVTESFPTIVASGTHAAMPHYNTAPQPLKRGFCVIDCGVIYNHYCSDMTRTIYLGTPSTDQIGLYRMVYVAQQSALAKIKSGITCAELYQCAAQSLGAFKKYFIHSLGHGLGIEIHESPSLSPRSKERLREGMVITIEPGIYLPNKAGIRIEDSIIVTADGYELLTKTPKELICLKGW